MKLMTVIVPCYNSAEYMRKSIDSILVGGEEIEIIIVNDGSSDQTAEIADAYAEQFPTIIRVIHQENAGHGGALNTGILHAKGLYLKVVDSDDWLNEEALHKVLDTLRKMVAGPNTLDMLVCNYVYEKQGKSHKRVVSYKGAFPENKIFSWEKAGHLHKGQYILMHSVIYRTQLLQQCGLRLPKHTFYVDNLFVYQPLPYVKTLYYLNVDLYRYFIGREDQSVNEKVMMERIDQQLRVNKLMIDIFSSRKISNKKLRKYMRGYLEIITTISSVFLLMSGTEENYNKKKELWKYIKSKDARLYYRLNCGIMGGVVNLPGKNGRKVPIAAYKVAKRFIGFN